MKMSEECKIREQIDILEGIIKNPLLTPFLLQHLKELIENLKEQLEGEEE